MFILRLFIMAFLVIATTAASYELFELMRSNGWRPIMAGQFWHNLHPESLDSLRVVLQREVHPALWDQLIAPILRQPAWLVAGVPGVLLLSLDIWLNKSQQRRPRRNMLSTVR